jgi:hypothetical protein
MEVAMADEKLVEETDVPHVRLPQRSVLVQGPEQAPQATPAPVAPSNPQASPPGEKPLEDRLLDLTKEEGIGEAEKSAAWTLVNFLAFKKKQSSDRSKP